MNAKEILIIATEEQHELFAVELVQAIRDGLANQETGYDEGVQPLHASLEPRFWGLVGPRLATTGVESITGGGTGHASGRRDGSEKLYRMAIEREPNAIICIGSVEFRDRLLAQIQSNIRHQAGTFYNWRPLFFDVEFPAAPHPDRLKRSQVPSHRLRDLTPIKIVVEPNATACTVAESVVRNLLQSEAQFPLKAHLY